MEGQGGKHKSKQFKGKSSSSSNGAASSSKPSASKPPDKPDTAALTTDLVPFIGDLLCVILPIAELGLLALNALTTLLDSGASSHIIMSRDFFWTYNPSNARNVKTANHGSLVTLAAGDCVIRFTLGNQVVMVKLRDCLHAPDACVNLLLVGRMVMNGVSCNFGDGGVSLVFGGKKFGSGRMIGRLFVLGVEFVKPPALPPAATQTTIAADPFLNVAPSDVACFTKVPLDIDLWHHRMGHIGDFATRTLLKSTTGASFPDGSDLSRCEPCIIGKHPRHPAPKSLSPKSTSPLELIHCDHCGPFPVLTPHGKLYFILFIDDFTGAINIQLLATKDQAFAVWCVIQAKWENKLDRKVKKFRCDGGGELMGKDQTFITQMEERGIEHDVTPPYEHWKNGKVERAMRTLQGHILSMLTAAQLPLTYWGEATLTAGYLYNLTITSTLLSGVTPFEMFHGRKPDVSHLRVWGVQCFAHVPVELQTKLGVKSRECLFMGYPPSQRGYRVQDLKSHHFFTSGSVIFDENIPYHALHEISTSPIDYSSLPFDAGVAEADVPDSPTAVEDLPADVVDPPDGLIDPDVRPSTPPNPVLDLPIPTTPVRCNRQPAAAPAPSPSRRSQRGAVLSKAGEAYTVRMMQAKDHLMKCRAAAVARRADRDAGLLTGDADEFSCLVSIGVFDDRALFNSSSDVAMVSLNVDDYLNRDNDMLTESVLLSICSDV